MRARVARYAFVLSCFRAALLACLLAVFRFCSFGERSRINSASLSCVLVACVAGLLVRSGISYFFKRLTTANSKGFSEAKGTGFSTGTIHAYQYCPLLFQLLFALVPNDNILPDTLEWWTTYVQQDPPVNIFSNVISAITSCLDFYFLSVKRVFDETRLESFEKLTGNMRAQLMIMHKIRNCLIARLRTRKSQATGDSDEVETLVIPETYFQAIKPHLCEHLVNNVRVFGAVIMTSDTQQTERILKAVCKENFEQTSKNYKNLQAELIAAFNKNLRAEDLRKYVDRRRAHAMRTTPVILPPEAKDFHNYTGFARVELLWEPKTNQWKAEEDDNRNLHDLLSVKQVIDILKTTKAIASPIFRVIQDYFTRPNLFTIHLYRGVNIYNSHHKTDDCLKNETFTIHCDRNYPVRKASVDESKPVFSFVEVKYVDGCSYCRVMAIVDITVKESFPVVTQQFLIVCRLTRTDVDSPLPFSLYTYEIQTGRSGFQLCLDLISVGSAFRPCIAHPYEPSGSTEGMTKRGKFQHQHMFFVIPYDRVGKTPNTNWPSDDIANVYSEDARTGLSLPLMATTHQQAAALAELPDEDTELAGLDSSDRKRKR